MSDLTDETALLLAQEIRLMRESFETLSNQLVTNRGVKKIVKKRKFDKKNQYKNAINSVIPAELHNKFLEN